MRQPQFNVAPSGLPEFGGPEMFALRPPMEGAPLIDLSTLPIRRMRKDTAPWRPKYPTLLSVCSKYIHEHAKDNTHDPARAAAGLLEWVNVLGPDFDVRGISRNDGRRVIDALKARGLAPGSIRRIMAWGSAALHHARREGRLEKDIPKFPRVPGGAPRARWLSRQEWQRLMDTPKCERAQRFLVLAFATGARSRAIEELTWARVDLETRTIDYRESGKDYKNKRRAVVPISASLLASLQAWPRADDFVIGAGPSKRATSCHHLVKRAMRAAGIDEKGVCRHVTRHTVASWMLQGDKERGIAPAPVHFVAQLLADNVAMIERVYGHVMPKHLADATRVLP
jgi:integrase